MYEPISCDFHSELELLALRQKDCEIIFRNEQNLEETINSKIKDLYTLRKEEFLLLPNGKNIRLDRIISVDGKVLANYFKNCPSLTNSKSRD